MIATVNLLRGHMQHNQSVQNAKVVGGIVITAVALIAVYFLILENKPPEQVSASATNSSTIAVSENSENATSTSTPNNKATANNQLSSTQSSSTSNSAYKDGQYTTSVSYQVPKHNNTISITVTLSNDTITNVSAKNSYSDRESSEYIDDFMSNLSSAIVSKKIDNAQLSKLAGASLTTEAYNNAITQIANQAKS